MSWVEGNLKDKLDSEGLDYFYMRLVHNFISLLTAYNNLWNSFFHPLITITINKVNSLYTMRRQVQVSISKYCIVHWLKKRLPILEAASKAYFVRPYNFNMTVFDFK